MKLQSNDDFRASLRQECRGAHMVVDYEHPADYEPAPLGRNDSEWMKHTLVLRGYKVVYKPVRKQPLTVDYCVPRVRTF